MGVNARDPIRKRATYNVAYPTDDITVDRADLNRMRAEPQQKGRITSKKITWDIKFSDIPAFVYDQCNFHVTHGLAESEIISLTFQDATFTSCFLGTVLFRSVRFKNCEFRRCDFSHAHFENCLFEECVFTDCTAWSTRFTATVIDPEQFFKGVTLPLDNFADKPLEKPAMKQAWIDEQARLAGMLLRSAEDCRHVRFAEVASRLSKSKNLTAEWWAFRLRRRPWFSVLSLGASYLVLKATRGGTSLSRLLGIAAAAIILLSLLLPEPALVPEWASKSRVSRIMGAANAFFGFGFTNLRLASTLDMSIGTVSGIAGLLWYALFAAVLIRRFYR